MKVLESYSSLSATILRIVVGWILIVHGVPKVLTVGGIEQFAGFVGSVVGSSILGWIFGILTIVVEIVGGVLLILGLKVRITALAVGILFLGIAFMVHGADFWATFNANSGDAQTRFEFPLLIAAVGFALAFMGPGRYSITRD